MSDHEKRAAQIAFGIANTSASLQVKKYSGALVVRDRIRSASTRASETSRAMKVDVIAGKPRS